MALVYRRPLIQHRKKGVNPVEKTEDWGFREEKAAKAMDRVMPLRVISFLLNQLWIFLNHFLGQCLGFGDLGSLRSF